MEKTSFTWRVEKDLILELKKTALDEERTLAELLSEIARKYLVSVKTYSKP